MPAVVVFYHGICLGTLFGGRAHADIGPTPTEASNLQLRRVARLIFAPLLVDGTGPVPFSRTADEIPTARQPELMAILDAINELREEDRAAMFARGPVVGEEEPPVRLFVRNWAAYQFASGSLQRDGFSRVYDEVRQFGWNPQEPSRARAYFRSFVDRAVAHRLGWPYHEFASRLFKVSDSDQVRRFSLRGSNLADQTLPLFLSEFVGPYFNRLPERSKARIGEALVLDPRAGQLGSRAGRDVFFHNAGPNFQKLMQRLARLPRQDPDLTSLLVSLESQVSRVPEDETVGAQRLEPRFWRRDHTNRHFRMADMFWDSSGQPKPTRFPSERPVGAGTMALTYKVETMIEPGRWTSFAFRKMRPLADLLDEEPALLGTVQSIESHWLLKRTVFAHFGEILRSVLELTRIEGSLTENVDRQNALAKAYSDRRFLGGIGRGRTADIVVPRAYGLLSDDIMAQEWMDFERFDSFRAEHPEIARLAVEDLATIWVREALFMSGWLHADPHPGNVGFKREVGHRVKVVLLDGGLSAQISPTDRRALLMLAYTLQSGSDALLLELSQNLVAAGSPRGVDSRLVHNAAESAHGDASKFLENLLLQGIRLKTEIIAFQRGSSFLDQLLLDTGSDQRLSDIIGYVGRRVLAADGLSRMLTGNAWRRTPLTISDLRALGRAEGHSRPIACQDYFVSR